MTLLDPPPRLEPPPHQFQVLFPIGPGRLICKLSNILTRGNTIISRNQVLAEQRIWDFQGKKQQSGLWDLEVTTKCHVSFTLPLSEKLV